MKKNTLISIGFLGLGLSCSGQKVDIVKEADLGYYKITDNSHKSLTDTLMQNSDIKQFDFKNANIQLNNSEMHAEVLDTIGLSREKCLEQYAIARHNKYSSGVYPGTTGEFSLNK